MRDPKSTRSAPFVGVGGRGSVVPRDADFLHEEGGPAGPVCPLCVCNAARPRKSAFSGSPASAFRQSAHGVGAFPGTRLDSERRVGISSQRVPGLRIWAGLRCRMANLRISELRADYVPFRGDPLLKCMEPCGNRWGSMRINEQSNKSPCEQNCAPGGDAGSEIE